MKILETFTCYADAAYGDTTYIQLTSDKNGDELWGEYPTAELAKHDIREGDRFLVRTVDYGEETGVEFEKLPPCELSPETQAEIEKLRLMIDDIADWTEADY